MSRIEGKEYDVFIEAYNSTIKENPDLECCQHEIATFSKLFLDTARKYDLLNDKCDRHNLREFAWQMWKFGFAYDYPEEDDYNTEEDGL